MKRLMSPAVERFPGVDLEALSARMAAEAELVRRVPRLVFDNVAEFYAGHDRLEWDIRQDIPNWAPPFGEFFAEWTEPQKWNMGSGVQELPVSGQVGMLVRAVGISDDDRAKVQDWHRAIVRMIGVTPHMTMDRGRLAAALEKSRWLMHVPSVWAAFNQRPLWGTPLCLGYGYLVFVADDGKAVDQFAAGLGLNCPEDLKDSTWSPLHILGLGLSFCHCKNVTSVEAADDRGERWHRRSGVPVFTFRTLDIGPMREVLRREGRSEELGIQRALHICRGHFAHYGEDRPLFGKYVGTFWRPDHVRGKPEAGAVVKNYNVNPS